MAISHLSTTSQSSDSLSGTFAMSAITFTAGAHVVLAIAWEQAVTITTVSDGVNTWNSTTASNGASDRVQIYYAENVSGGSTSITITWSGSSQWRRAIVSQYSGVATSSSLDQQNGNTGNGSTDPTTGNITTTQADELVYCITKLNGGETFSSPTINSVAANFRPTSPLSDTAGWDLIVAATFTGGGAVATTSTNAWAAKIVSFKASGGAPAAKKRVLPALLAQRALMGI